MGGGGNHRYLFNLKHIESKGVGYDSGYTTFEGFFTGKAERFIPFLDARAHVFNNDKWATNVGIGTRYIFNPCKSLIGANVYYDYRQTKHKSHFNQMGVGLEGYYSRYEFRVNGYLPVGAKRRLYHSETQSTVLSAPGASFNSFLGNNILINFTEGSSSTKTIDRYEGAMKGFDAEAGVHLVGDRKSNDLYFGVGPYYYDLHEDRSTWGGRARLKAKVTKYLFLELIDTYDHVFHNRFQGSITLSLPFGGKRSSKKQNRGCSNVMDWQAFLPPERQEIIVVDKFKKTFIQDPDPDPIGLAINPTTGQPYFVVFVNNTNAGVHSGTFENPYQNLGVSDGPPSALSPSGSGPNDIIYVYGTGSSTHMSGGNYSLQDSQRLWGSSLDHPLLTAQGLITVPAQNGTKPSIGSLSNITPTITIVSNNNEVSGFQIATEVSGIFSSTNITNANINHNDLTGVNEGGLDLGSSGGVLSGIISITDNTHMTTNHANPNIAYGLACQNATVFILSNTTNIQPTGGAVTAMNIGATDCLVTIQNNILDAGVGTGISVGVAGSSDCTIQNNVISVLAGGAGFEIDNDFAPTQSTFNVIGNTISGPTNDINILRTRFASNNNTTINWENNTVLP